MEKYKRLGGIIPKCINIGCTKEVAVRHWTNTGLPSLKTECTRCAGARIKGKSVNGVQMVKKHMCENSDGRLGFLCPIDSTRYSEFPSDCYHMDHINGDHTDNRIDNIMTLCTMCHTRKGKMSGDFNGSKSSSLRFVQSASSSASTPERKSVEQGACVSVDVPTIV